MDAEKIRNIKHQFYTYRNGQLADLLRNAGDEHKIIFGLNLPQIVAIAREVEKSAEVSQFLWDNSSTRESQLMAPMIYPIELFDSQKAHEWIATVFNIEVADLLCHRLLRYLEFAQTLCDEYIDSINDMKRYTALRLALNLLALNKYNNIDFLLNCAHQELAKKNSVTKSIASAIITEINFKKES